MKEDRTLRLLRKTPLTGANRDGSKAAKKKLAERRNETPIALSVGTGHRLPRRLVWCEAQIASRRLSEETTQAPGRMPEFGASAQFQGEHLFRLLAEYTVQGSHSRRI